MHDVVIKGGTVIDGTGAAQRTADVACTDGVITGVGRDLGQAKRTIDADGLLVTPGFIDVHTHFDGQSTWDPHLTPSCWHGVSTAVMGNCGVGFAPADPARHDNLIELMEGVEDIPGTALHEGIRWGWESFPEYLDVLSRTSLALDVGTQIPHAALRAYVMRDRALEDATSEDIALMAKLVEEGLLAGALGFSTGRTAGHRDARGNVVPGTYAALDELEALASAVAAAGRGVLQVVPAGVGGFIIGDAPDALNVELDWMIEQGLRTRIPITFSVNQQGTITGEGDLDHWKPWFERCREANAKGANIRPQVGARCFGLLIGLQSRLNPLQYRPSYAEIADLPLAEKVSALRTPSFRERIMGERGDYSGMMMADHFRGGTFEVVYPLVGLDGGALDYEPGPDQSVAAIARATGRDPWDVTLDLMLEGEGRNFLLMPLLNYGGGSYDAVREMIMDPMTVQGLGDGGAHVGLVVDASVNTYLLSHWVRDRTRGERIPLEYAVQRLTSDPASFYGMRDRGVIAPGMKADLNLIDFANLGIDYPELVNDLPAGASRLIQKSFGYVSTIVAGEEVVANGELTDARPGRLVRSR